MIIRIFTFRIRIVAFFILLFACHQSNAQNPTQTLFEQDFENATFFGPSNGLQQSTDMNAWYQVPHTPPTQPAVNNPVNGLYTTSGSNPCGVKKLGAASGTHWYYCNISDTKIFQTKTLTYTGPSTPITGGNYNGTVTFKYSAAIVGQSGTSSTPTGINFFIKVTNISGGSFQSPNIILSSGCDDSWNTATFNFSTPSTQFFVEIYSVNGEIATGNEIRLDDIKITMDMPASPLTNGGTIGYDQTGCGTFDPANLTSVAAASGGTGSGAIIYRWKANGAIISGATGITYDPGPITTTTTYIREAQRTGTSTWVASNTVTVTVAASCNIDFALNIEQTSSSLIPPGGSATMDVYAENISSVAGTYSITLSKPSAASGLTLSFGSSSQWTVTTSGNQFIITGNAPVPGNSSVVIPVTITRTGGTKGAFTLSGTISAPGDTNVVNNKASTTVSKL